MIQEEISFRLNSLFCQVQRHPSAVFPVSNSCLPPYFLDLGCIGFLVHNQCSNPCPPQSVLTTELCQKVLLLTVNREFLHICGSFSSFGQGLIRTTSVAFFSESQVKLHFHCLPSPFKAIIKALNTNKTKQKINQYQDLQVVIKTKWCPLNFALFCQWDSAASVLIWASQDASPSVWDYLEILDLWQINGEAFPQEVKAGNIFCHSCGKNQKYFSQSDMML